MVERGIKMPAAKRNPPSRERDEVFFIPSDRMSGD